MTKENIRYNIERVGYIYHESANDSSLEAAALELLVRLWAAYNESED